MEEPITTKETKLPAARYPINTIKTPYGWRDRKSGGSEQLFPSVYSLKKKNGPPVREVHFRRQNVS